MDHQDWKTVVVRKKKGSINNSVNNPKQKVVGFNAGKNSKNKVDINTKKLAESEELKHNYVPKEVAKEIQQLRQAKDLTIKELANKLNMNKQDLVNIEQGKAIYNKALITKIKRSLK